MAAFVSGEGQHRGHEGEEDFQMGKAVVSGFQKTWLKMKKKKKIRTVQQIASRGEELSVLTLSGYLFLIFKEQQTTTTKPHLFFKAFKKCLH